MAENQQYKEFRLTELPEGLLNPGDRYYIPAGTDSDGNETFNLYVVGENGVPRKQRGMSSDQEIKLAGIEEGAQVNPELRTINNESLIGTGDLTINTSGVTDVVDPGFIPATTGTYYPAQPGVYGDAGTGQVTVLQDDLDGGNVFMTYDGTTLKKVVYPINLSGYTQSGGSTKTTADLDTEIASVRSIVGVNQIPYSGVLPFRLYTDDSTFVTSTGEVVQTDNGAYDEITRTGTANRVVYFSTGQVFNPAGGRLVFRGQVTDDVNAPSLGIGFSSGENFRSILWGANSGAIIQCTPHTVGAVQTIGGYSEGDEIKMEFYVEEGVQKVDCAINGNYITTVNLPVTLAGTLHLAVRGLFTAQISKLEYNNSLFATRDEVAIERIVSDNTYVSKSGVTVINPNLIKLGINTVDNAQVGLPTSTPPYPYQPGQTLNQIAVIVTGLPTESTNYVWNYGEGNHHGRWENSSLGAIGTTAAFISGFSIYADTPITKPAGADRCIFTLKRADTLEPSLPAGRKMQQGDVIQAGGVTAIDGEPILTSSAKEEVVGNTTYTGEIEGVPFKVITSDTYDYLSNKDTLVILFHGHGGTFNTFNPNAAMQAYMRENSFSWASITIQTPDRTVGYGNQPSMNRVVALYNHLMEKFNFHRDVIFVGGSMGMTTAGNILYTGLIPVKTCILFGGVPNLRLRFQNGDNTDRIPIRAAYGMASDGSDDANIDEYVRGYDWWLKGLIVDNPAGTEKKMIPCPLYMYVGGGDGNFVDFGGTSMYERLRDAINRTGGLSTYYEDPALGHADESLWDVVLSDGVLEKSVSNV